MIKIIIQFLYIKNKMSAFKVVLVGESGVGKTSIITQFIDQTFQEDQQLQQEEHFSQNQ